MTARDERAAVPVVLGPDLEAEYRAWEWATAMRRARIAVITASSLFLLFVYSDFLFFGVSWELAGLIALRLSVGLFGFTLLAALRGPPRPARFDRLIIAWTIWAGLLTAVILPATRPSTWILHGFIVCIGIPAFYLLVPVSYVGGLVVGLGMLVGYLGLVLVTSDLSYMQGVVLTFALVAANLIGALANRSQQQSQRAMFLQQRSLKLAEESLNQLVDAVPFPVALLERAGLAVRRLNDAARAMFAGTDASAEDTIARLVASAPIVDGLPREVAITDARGEASWLLVSTRTIVHDGQPSLLSSFVDITTRKATEEALAAAKRDADEASRAKSAFLATMSHEMRTPLNSVLAAVQLLERATLGPTERDYVAIVRQCARDMQQLVDSILELARTDAAIAPTLGAFEPRSLARAIGERLAPRLTAPWVVIVDPAMPRLMGDVTRLQRVLLNLVDNAIKYGDGSPMTLTIEPVDGSVRFAVSNGGPSIPAHQRAAIFEPFVQLDRGDALRRGFGLGLAICRRDVAVMGGTLTLEDGPDTTFTFTLALSPALEDAPEPDAPPSRVPTRSLALLLAEDDPVSARLAATLLSHAGHRVTHVTSGPDAVARALAEPFDVVLMDMRMPGCDGAEATRRIRAADSERARVPIIATTANALAEDRARYLEAGVSALVPKPIDFDVLERTLATLVGAEARASYVDEPLLHRYARALGPAAALELMALCVETAGPIVEGLEAAFARGAADDVARLAHRLASAAHSAAFTPLGDAAAALEARAGEVELRHVTATWHATRRAFSELSARS